MQNNIEFEYIKGILFFRINDISFKDIIFIYLMIRDNGISNVVFNMSVNNYKVIILIKICNYLLKKNKGKLVICGGFINNKNNNIKVFNNELEALNYLM